MLDFKAVLVVSWFLCDIFWGALQGGVAETRQGVLAQKWNTYSPGKVWRWRKHVRNYSKTDQCCSALSSNFTTQGDDDDGDEDVNDDNY